MKYALISALLLVGCALMAAEPMLAMGENHTLYLADNGTVWAWGANANGQLGDNSTTASSTPKQVAGLSQVIQVAAGYAHSVALRADGRVYVWGNNAYGQAGNGSYGTNQLVPTLVNGVTNVKQITAGAYHVLALLGNGTVRGWGYNGVGPLGDGAATTYQPNPVSLSGGHLFKMIAAGAFHSLGLRDDGTVWSWGYDFYGQLGNDAATTAQSSPVQVSGLSGIMHIAAGANHSLAVDENGQLYGWGHNGFGQIATNTTTPDSPATQPTPVALFAAVVERCAAGANHSMALRSNGVTAFFGANANGQCRSTASTIQAPSVNIAGLRAVGTGFGNHSAVITDDGRVQTWGSNNTGQLGNGGSTDSSTAISPSAPWPLSGIYQVARGQYHNVALKADGSVYVWGYNANGQGGQGSTTPSYVITPTQVDLGTSRVKAISSGIDYGDHNLAVTTDGKLWAWGQNNSGQIGDGSTNTPRSTPFQYSGSTVRAAGAGDYHSLLVSSSGTLQATGRDDNGQLGDDATLASKSNFTAVSGISNALQVVGGNAFSLALLADGTLRSWGQDTYGQLGDDTANKDATTAVTVALPVGVKVLAIAGGSLHALALGSDGRVLSWGYNGEGQLGTGDTTSRATPGYVKIPAGGGTTDMTNVVAIAAGVNHSLAITADGSVYAWGNNGNGQLGDGSTTQSYYPVAIGLSNAVCIEAGYVGSVAALADGTVRAWGFNGLYQVGDGTTNQALQPTQTVGGWLPSIAIDTSNSVLAASESGPVNLRYVLTRSGSTAGSLSVNYTLTGGSDTVAGLDYTHPGGSVTFPSSSSSVTVTVPILNDALDEDEETLTLALSSGTSYRLGSLTSAQGTIADNDTAGITVSPTSGLLTSETGATANFTIRLNSQPTSSVSIAVQSSNTAEGTVSPSTLWFGPAATGTGSGSNSSNLRLWSDSATITVTGIDDQSVDGTVNYSIITQPASSTDTRYGGLNPPDVSLSNSDNDVAGFTFYTFNFATGSRNYSAQVLEEAAVLSASSLTAGGIASLGASGLDGLSYLQLGMSVELSGANAGKVGMISAWDNNAINDTITISAFPGDTLILSADTSVILKLGAFARVGLKLNTKPNAGVTVGLSSNNSNRGTVANAQVGWDSVTWNTFQVITVYGVNDDIDQTSDERAWSLVTAAASSADPNYSALNPADIALATLDDDQRGVLMLASDGTTALTEGGATDTVRVRLQSQPPSDVTITLASASAQVSLSTTSLVFTNLTWKTPQVVTVTALDDPDIEGDLTYTNDLSATVAAVGAGSDYLIGLASTPLSVDVKDNDSAGYEISPSSLVVTENSSATVQVRLRARPQSSVSIDASVVVSGIDSDGGAATSVDLSGLSWGYADWNTWKPLVVSAPDDAGSANETWLLVLDNPITSDAAFTGVDPDDVTVNVLDDDTPRIVVSAGGLGTLVEGDVAGSYSVELGTDPGAGKLVVVAVSGAQYTTLSPSTLYFNGGSSGSNLWDTPQTVTVTPKSDDLVTGMLSDTLTHAVVATTSTADYPTSLPTVALLVNIRDPDTRGVTVEPQGQLSVAEGGGATSFRVRLASQPAVNTVYRVSSDDDTEALVSLDGSSFAVQQDLTFTSSNWNVGVLVYVQAFDDSLDDGNQFFLISCAWQSGDTGYQFLDPSPLGGLCLDDDAVGVTISDTTLSLDEDDVGSPAAYTVVLNAQPVEAVGITVINDGQVTVSPQTAWFAPSAIGTGDGSSRANASAWNNPVSVTVTVVNDSQVEGSPHQARLLHSASGTGWFGVPIAAIDISIAESDSAGVSVITVGGEVSQVGLGAGFTVRGATSGGTAYVDNGRWDLSTVQIGQAVYLAELDLWTTVASRMDGGSGFDLVTFATAPSDINDTALIFAEAVLFEQFAGESLLVSTSASQATGVVQFPPGSDLSRLVVGQAVYLTQGALWATITDIQDAADTITLSEVPSDSSAETLIFAGAVRVRLQSQPTSVVSMQWQVTDPDEVAIFPDTLSFTAQSAVSGGWDQYQVLNLIAVDDNVADGDQMIRLSAVQVFSPDPNYNGLALPAVMIANRDNDSAAVIVDDDDNPITGLNLSVDENGSVDSFTVVLGSQPQADLTYALTLEGSDSDHLALEPASLVFTPDTWHIAQTVTVRGQDLDAYDNNAYTGLVSATVHIAVPSESNGSDAAYAIIDPQDVVVQVLAANAPPTVAELSELTILEDATGTDAQLIITGLGSGQAGEVDTLVLSAVSDNLGILDVDAIIYPYQNDESQALLPFITQPDASGTTTITLTVSDSIDSTERSFLVTVTPVNDAPSLDLDDTDFGSRNFATSFTEGDAPVAICALPMIADVDSVGFLQLGVVMSNLADAGYETLSLAAVPPGMSQSFDASTGSLLISAPDARPVETWSQILQEIRYENSSPDPVPGVRVLEVTVTDAGLATSVAVQALITVAGNERPPVVDLNGGDVLDGIDSTFTVFYREGEGPHLVGDPQWHLDDPDSTLLQGATVRLETVYDAGSELLSVDTAGTALSASYTAATGVLSVSGAGTLFDYAQVLYSLTYEHSSDTPTEGLRRLGVVVSDGVVSSQEAFATLEVQASNDNPQLAISGDLTLAIGQTLNLVAASDGDPGTLELVLTPSDPDHALSELLFVVPLRPGLGRLFVDGVELFNGGSFTWNDVLAGLVRYVHNGQLAGQDGFALQLQDPAGGDSVQIITLEITGLVPPAISASPTDLAWTEGDPPLRLDDSMLLSDPDSANIAGGHVTVSYQSGGGVAGDTLAYDPLLGSFIVNGVNLQTLAGDIAGTISGGNDGTALVITCQAAMTPALAQGVLRAITWTNTGDNPGQSPRVLLFTANDGTNDSINGATSSATPVIRTLVVTPVNDAPVDIGQEELLTVPRVSRSGRVAVRDPEGDALTYTLSGNPSKGTVSLRSDGSFDYAPFASVSGDDNVTLSVSDGALASALTIPIHITDVGMAAPRFRNNPPFVAIEGESVLFTPQVDVSTLAAPASLQFILSGASDLGIVFGVDGTLTWSSVPAASDGYHRLGILVTDSVSRSAAYLPIFMNVVPAPTGGG